MSLSDIERHVLGHAGTDRFNQVPTDYWSEYAAPNRVPGGRWVPYVGLKSAVRKLMRLGYVHARTANYSRIGNHAERNLAPEGYPEFESVQTQVMLTDQGKDLRQMVLDR